MEGGDGRLRPNRRPARFDLDQPRPKPRLAMRPDAAVRDPLAGPLRTFSVSAAEVRVRQSPASNLHGATTGDRAKPATHPSRPARAPGSNWCVHASQGLVWFWRTCLDQGVTPARSHAPALFRAAASSHGPASGTRFCGARPPPPPRSSLLFSASSPQPTERAGDGPRSKRATSSRR